MSGISPAVFLAATVLSGGISGLLVHFLYRHAGRLGMLDQPGHRQSHTVLTATGAGLGIIFALVLASNLVAHYQALNNTWMRVVLPLALLLSVVGWVDDRSSLSAALRFAVQLLVSCALLALLPGWSAEVSWWAWPLGVLAIVWVMNAYNFMDGSHGMAGFQGVFSGLVLFGLFVRADEPGLAVPALALAGVCLGFLPMNFPNARIFMGDSGSVPIGFALAALICLGIGQGAVSIPVGAMVLSIFLVDSSLTLLKRVIAGERWYTAHKQHIYQRLIDQGCSHSQVLLFYQAINLLVVAPVIMLARAYPDLACVLAGSLFLLMTTGWYAASLRLGVRK